MPGLLLIALLFVLCHVPAAAAPATLTVGWEDNPPLQMATEGERQGIDMDIARAMIERAGYQVRFVKIPWQRQLLMLESGDLDIAQSASMTEDRRRFAAWTTPYRKERTTLFAREAGAPKISRLRELLGKPVHIGYMRGSEFGGEFRELKSHAQFKALLQPLNSNQSALSMLRARRLDYVLEDQITFAYMAATQPGPAVVVANQVDADEVSFMLSLKTCARHPDLLQQLNTALRAMKASRAIEAIFAKYGLKP